MEKLTTVANDAYKNFSDFNPASLIREYKVYFSGSSGCYMDRDNSDDSGIDGIEPSTPPQPTANTTEPSTPAQPTANTTEPNIPPQPSGNTTEPSLPAQPTGNTTESTSSNAATGPGQNTEEASNPQLDSQYGLPMTE